MLETKKNTIIKKKTDKVAIHKQHCNYLKPNY